MSFVGTLIRHPRKLFLRRALFQIHLWAGVLLSLYVVVIALTGSILVFRSELSKAQLPSQLNSFDPQHVVSIATVLQKFQAEYPGGNISNLVLPYAQSPIYQLTAIDKGKHALTLAADPVTAMLYKLPRTWVDWIYDLHVYLLLGHAYGMQVNGAGAGVLMLLCITGLAVWWSGIKTWTRGLTIGWRRNWRRMNFDAHSVIGFWTLLIVSWWAFSGIYFAWYKQVSAVVALVSPLRGMVSPAASGVIPPGSQRISLDAILGAVHQVSDGSLYSLSDPSLIGEVVYALVDLRAPGDFSHRDIICLSTHHGRVLSVWHYGQNHSAGDWVLWAMHPLHFGTLWGTALKIVWALLGVSLAVLSITGLLMYWNRYLRHRV